MNGANKRFCDKKERQMKHLNYILWLITFIGMSVLKASAYDACIEGIYYNLDSKAKTAEVTSGDSKYTGSVAIPVSVENKGVVYPVTSIGKSAFEQCSRLTSVSIPNGVLSIKDDAFYKCN